jgi:hypothetical protein
MKVAVLSESSADEAAIRILVQGLLGSTTQAVLSPPPRTRGWKAVLTDVEIILKHLHYRTDADALAVVLDSDESPAHQKGHDSPGARDGKCRLCQLRATVAAVQSGLRPRQGRGPVKTALGLAVPAIEAWLLAGRDPHITESAWIQAIQSGSLPYTKNGLKQKAYGTDRPGQVMQTNLAVEHARGLVDGGKLGLLEGFFPSGFGAFANDMRGW